MTYSKLRRDIHDAGRGRNSSDNEGARSLFFGGEFPLTDIRFANGGAVARVTNGASRRVGILWLSAKRSTYW